MDTPQIDPEMRELWKALYDEELDEQMLQFIPASPQRMLLQSITDVMDAYQVTPEELSSFLKETPETVQMIIEDSKDTEKEPRFSEEQLLRFLRSLVQNVIRLPRVPRGGGEGRAPDPDFPEKVYMKCGDWLQELGFYPQGFSYPSTTYYNPSRNAHLQLYWDPYDVDLFVNLGPVRPIPDVVPLASSIPIHFFEKPMMQLKKGWNLGDTSNYQNLRRVITDIMEVYEQVLPEADEEFRKAING